MNKEPNYEDIQKAWTEAIESEEIGGARAESRQKLQVLRNNKYTWIGDKENSLRICIDKYLEGRK